MGVIMKCLSVKVLLTSVNFEIIVVFSKYKILCIYHSIDILIEEPKPQQPAWEREMPSQHMVFISSPRSHRSCPQQFITAPAPVSAPTLCQLTNTTHSTCGPLIIHGILSVVLIVMDEHHVTFGVDKLLQNYNLQFLFAFQVKVCFANYITNFSRV